MRLYNGIVLNPDRALPFVMVDIDNQTHRQWGSPLILPDDQISAILRQILAGAPAAVVVDLDLSGDRVKEGTGLIPALADSHGIPVFLARPTDDAGDDVASVHPPARPSVLDGLVEQLPNIAWASTRFVVSQDFVPRYWLNWDVVCDDRQPVALPSMPLLLSGVVGDVEILQCLSLPTSLSRGDPTLFDLLLGPSGRYAEPV